MRGGNPFFSIKRVSSPHAPLFPKRTTKGLAALWTLAVSLVWLLGILAHVFGLDVGNGSGERFCWCFWEHSLISIILCIFMENLL